MTRRILFLVLLSSLILSALSACSSTKAGDVPMADMRDMPAEVQNASTSVQQAYQFAVANPEALKAVPCYCGCGGVGHTSNYSCYVQSDTDGKIVFDQHALGCSICVDIALDTLRMVKEGKPLPEVRAAIDATYGQFGPTNME